jgi:hypothetical protein
MLIALISIFPNEVFASFLLELPEGKEVLMHVAQGDPGQAIKLAGTGDQISS